ncbi:hypothetical protein [Vibrio harveyi]|uniref:hypothetical protein n=1 Tax=Vibrio harveyi TaxID=669 RepID=UPI003D70BFF3
MTTLVYDHENKIVAYDSRHIKDESIIISDSLDKLHIVNDHKFLGCGKVGDINLLIKAYLDKQPPECEMLRAIIWSIESDRVRRVGFSDNALWVNTLQYSATDGSGADFALAALDMGKSASEAVEYAMKRDPFTGGKINTIYLG